MQQILNLKRWCAGDVNVLCEELNCLADGSRLKLDIFKRWIPQSFSILQQGEHWKQMAAETCQSTHIEYMFRFIYSHESVRREDTEGERGQVSFPSIFIYCWIEYNTEDQQIVCFDKTNILNRLTSVPFLSEHAVSPNCCFITWVTNRCLEDILKTHIL